MRRFKAFWGVLAALLFLSSIACAAAQNLLVTPTPMGAKTLRIHLLHASQDATVWLRYYENAETGITQKQKPDRNGRVTFVVPAENGGQGASYGFQLSSSETTLHEMKTFRIPPDLSLVVLEFDVARDTFKIVEGSLIVTIVIPFQP